MYNLLSQCFIVKLYTKSLLIKILKRDKQLHFFRRLEKCSVKISKCQAAIEFLRLCQNFAVTPTFAKVDATKTKKWEKSSEAFEKQVVAEELKTKHSYLKELKDELRGIFNETRGVCSTLRLVAIAKILTSLRRNQFQDLMKDHAQKLSRLLYKNFDVDEHINNISSYSLDFFEKLVLCRGLKFSYPQKPSSKDVQVSFEKLYWKLEPLITDTDKKGLANATLRSIALNYIDKKSPIPPKSLLLALNKLKKRDDIVVTKPDKGSGVVIMDKSDYLRLLSDASIADTNKFIEVSCHPPKTRGRPPKHYHPLIQKEKELNKRIRRILPKSVADVLCSKGSRLAHLYGLPKTHKRELSMRPILSATGTYNYSLAKWLDEKLKPLSSNQFSVKDIFDFADEIRDVHIESDHLLASYDVTALFTNVPLHETIHLLVDRAFTDDWFNKTYDLSLRKEQLVELLEIATTKQLFQFDGLLYEQLDGVAMGSPLGPLLANSFMCSIEERLNEQGLIPSYYRRYVDDTLVIMPDAKAADDFLTTLNNSHSDINFTMELANNNRISFLGMDIIKNDNKLDTSVYRKPTNTGLLLHYDSHVEKQYKSCLIKTMIYRAYRLSSTRAAFDSECVKLRSIFSKLGYPINLINSCFSCFLDSIHINNSNNSTGLSVDNDVRTVRFSLPFKNQSSANLVKEQLKSLSSSIGVNIQPVFRSQSIQQVLRPKEKKPSLINDRYVVYKFECDQCDADYVGYTTRFLHQRILEHRYSAIGKHLINMHGGYDISNLSNLFSILKKCQSKVDCLLYEMLFIRDLKPSLNTQKDSIQAKVFT